MDFLATKGIEYLLVLGYLLVLIPSALLLRKLTAPAVAKRGWFRLPEGVSLHPGHAWVRREGRSLLRLGMDDFAVKLLGVPEGIDLPTRGQQLKEAGLGWKVLVDGERVPILAPVSGRVARVNERVLREPGIAFTDPYGEGWLVEVEPADDRTVLGRLFDGEMARRWLEETEAGVRALIGGELGTVLQDGGAPVPGFARELDPEAWTEIAGRFLLNGQVGESEGRASPTSPADAAP